MSEFERWASIPRAPKYEASNLGRIAIFDDGVREILEPRKNRQGYLQVRLRTEFGSRIFLVHRLVLEAFVGPCPPGMMCRHFPDRTRSNNQLSNIQWGTAKENSADMIVHGTRAKTVSDEDARAILRLWQNGVSYMRIARMARMRKCEVIAFVMGRRRGYIAKEFELPDVATTTA